jgi:GNAT superfamily N-acetyltransferase/RimJ/RimL family protein N-acetyltransferase
MSDLEIVEVDAFDPVSFDPWWRSYHDAEATDRGASATIWQLEELRAQMQDAGRRTWMGGWSGILDGEVVTTGWMGTPLLDNLDRANLAVTTIEGHRRRGYATAMLAHVEQVARDRGRSLLGGEAYWPYAAGPDGAGAGGREFARAHGYELALGDVQRRLSLPVADGLLDELAAEAAGHHPAYTLRSWVGPVPDELVDDFADIQASLMTEAPTGELDIEPEQPDVEALREGEQLLVRQGRVMYVTVAIDGTGRIAAYTDLVTTIHEPDRAYQWGTLVRRADRGHRLGLGIKIANLRLLQAERPDVVQLTTFNAEVNAHMIGVNERLGFVPVERLGEFQKKPG